MLIFLMLFLFAPSRARAVELTINNPVVNGLEVSVDASLSATSNYYLQLALQKQDGANYFGGGYLATPTIEEIVSSFIKTDIQSASWSARLTISYDPSDSAYKGPGSYLLKLFRYTGKSTQSAGVSNTLTLDLLAPLPVSPIPTPTPTPSPSPDSSPTSSNPSTSFSGVLYSPSPLPTITLSTASLAPPVIDFSNSNLGTVAGQTINAAPTSSPGAYQSPQPRTSYLTIGIGITIFGLASYLGIIKLYDQTPDMDSHS